ncbi:MAG: class I SAM-dependent methyltransferase [Acidobacteria bacterium]|nr:class I SAM-dependent methyltransferase [Acidobacteriota bacterium]
MSATDPLAGSTWSRPETVAGFTSSPPNATLVRFAQDELHRRRRGKALDLGCGAGRNAIPLAAQGWDLIGLDLSLPMLEAAVAGSRRDDVQSRARFVLAPMDALPIHDDSCDLVIAHGIWNLAPSSAVFRRALREAARVARIGAGLFVFTFSRHTLPPDATPVSGEPFVFTQFSGEPQCFVTADQLLSELAAEGFEPDPAVPLTELNRPGLGRLQGGAPVIYEAAFRRVALRSS